MGGRKGTLSARSAEQVADYPGEACLPLALTQTHLVLACLLKARPLLRLLWRLLLETWVQAGVLAAIAV